MTAENNTHIRVDNLQKHFLVQKGFLFSRRAGAVKVVDGISFEIKQGETLGLAGESGCGKSTAGRSILRLLQPAVSRVFYEDVEVTTLDPEALRRLSPRRRQRLQSYRLRNPLRAMKPFRGETCAPALRLRLQKYAGNACKPKRTHGEIAPPPMMADLFHTHLTSWLSFLPILGPFCHKPICYNVLDIMPRNPHKRRCTARVHDPSIPPSAQPGNARRLLQFGPIRTAQPGNARPCNAWALPHTDPPRCNMHRDPERHCRATTSRGTPCRIQPPPAKTLCHIHARYTQAPRRAVFPSRRCRALTATGKPCRHWALRYSIQSLCRVHARGARWRLPGAGDDGNRCTARTLSGKRCRRWALRHRRAPHAGPLCWLHAHPHRHGRIRHSYYRRVPHFTPAQRAALAALARDEERPLAAELSLARLKFHFLLAYLKRQDLAPGERLSATRLAFRNVCTITRLLRARKRLADNP